VFQNRAPRGTYGSRRQEVTGGWRELHNEEHQNLHSSANMVRMIKQIRMRWVEHVAHMAEMRNPYKFSNKNLYGREKLKDIGVDGRITLKLILKKYDMRIWIRVMSRMMGIYSSNHEAENLLAR
jgi:hypothetical protein